MKPQDVYICATVLLANAGAKGVSGAPVELSFQLPEKYIVLPAALGDKPATHISTPEREIVIPLPKAQFDDMLMSSLRTGVPVLDLRAISAANLPILQKAQAGKQ